MDEAGRAQGAGPEARTGPVRDPSAPSAPAAVHPVRPSGGAHPTAPRSALTGEHPVLPANDAAPAGHDPEPVWRPVEGPAGAPRAVEPTTAAPSPPPSPARGATPRRPAPPNRPSGAGARSLHDFTVTTIRGEQQSLAAYRGRVVLVVNTATRCAFTPQLEGLQTLQLAFADRGFTVLGFPSDQFHQDPGTDEDTEKICTSAYDVTFPMFSKVDVNGSGADPLWTWLRGEKGGVLGGRIAWNFTKFLVSAEGRVLRRYAPPVPPVRIARRIETELGIAPGSTRLP